MSKPGPGSSPAVEKLAEVFANQLLTATDPKAVADLKSRLQSFLKDHPSANTIGVRITLGEGDYNRAEALALKWVADPSADAARAEALTILKTITPELNDLSAEGLKEVERGNKALEDARGGARIEQIDQALQRTAALAGRVTYFACWANYYRNLLQTDDDSDKAGFQAARLGFLRLLGIPPDAGARGRQPLASRQRDPGPHPPGSRTGGAGLGPSGRRGRLLHGPPRRGDARRGARLGRPLARLGAPARGQA